MAVDEGNCVHACYLDISKAFDRVDHSILLQKLQAHGIAGKLLNWLESYLQDRFVQVQVDGALSKKIATLSGVQQGSVLGPLLFLIYVNDIPKLTKCKIVLFADDIKLWVRVKSAEDCMDLQRDLDTLYHWSIQNRLPFNPKKCKMLLLGKPFHFTYQFGLDELEWTSDEKDLGAWILNSLKPMKQCQVVYNTASKLLGMLKRIFRRF